MHTQIQIETARLLLREYRAADWKAVHEYARQGDILSYEAWGPNSVKQTKNFINMVLQDQKKQPRHKFDLAIILKAETKLIGGCRFGVTDNDAVNVSIGYIINPIYWNNGYATEATIALTAYMSPATGIKTISATCDALNIASQKVLEKCGFKLKDTIKKDVLIKGRYRDTLVYEKEM